MGRPRTRKSGDTCVSQYGYILQWVEDHPFFPKKRGWVFQHRLRMADRLGRPLRRAEIVHHKNERRTDNRKRNLVLTKQGEHTRKFHRWKWTDAQRRAAVERWKDPRRRAEWSHRMKQQHAKGQLNRVIGTDERKRRAINARESWKDPVIRAKRCRNISRAMRAKTP